MIKVQIDFVRLSDSPYCSSNRGFFIFDQDKIKDFLQDLLHGNPTCYLISGYRGAGKTSFIEKIKEELLEKQNEYTNKIVFVTSNFSRYEKETYVLRRLIRNLFLELDTHKAFNEFKRQNKEGRTLYLELELIYRRTFEDIQSQDISYNRTEAEIEGKIDWIKAVAEFVKLAMPLVVILIYFLWFRNISSISDINKTVISIISLFGSLATGITLSQTIKSTAGRYKQQKAESLYDDNIAFYHFEKLLRNFRNLGFKIIFVLDELDKVEEEHLTKLLSEMKPYLLSGFADFIVVAGQELTYKYHGANKNEDEIIGSLFSRITHIALLKPENFLKDILPPLILTDNLSGKERIKLDEYISHLVFISKRVPRTFYSKLRQNLHWNNGEAYLEIQEESADKDVGDEISRNSKRLMIIEKIYKEEIEQRNYEKAVDDYLLMQLFGVTLKLISKEFKGTINDIYSKNKDDENFKIAIPYIESMVSQMIGGELLSKEIREQKPNLETISSSDKEPKKREQLDDESDHGNLADAELNFKTDIYLLIQNLFSVYKALGKLDDASIPVWKIIKDLENLLVFDFKIPNDSLLEDFFNNFDKVQVDPSIVRKAYDNFQKYELNIGRINFLIFQFATKHIAKGVCEKYQYTFLSKNNMDYDEGKIADFLGKSDNIDKPDLVFQFKYLKRATLKSDQIHSLIRDLELYNTKSEKGNYLYLFICAQQSQSHYESEHLKLRNLLSEANQDYLNRVRFIIFSTNEAYRLEELLKNKMEGIYSYSPFYKIADIFPGLWKLEFYENEKFNGAEIFEIVEGNKYFIKSIERPKKRDFNQTRFTVEDFSIDSSSKEIRFIKVPTVRDNLGNRQNDLKIIKFRERYEGTENNRIKVTYTKVELKQGPSPAASDAFNRIMDRTQKKIEKMESEEKI